MEKAEKGTGEEKATTAAKAMQVKAKAIKAAAGTAEKRAINPRSAEDRRKQQTTSSNPRRSKKWQ